VVAVDNGPVELSPELLLAVNEVWLHLVDPQGRPQETDVPAKVDATLQRSPYKFEAHPAATGAIEASWTRHQFVSHILSHPKARVSVSKLGRLVRERLEERLHGIWASSDDIRPFRWPVVVRLARA
jgi:hypothetical protein